MKKVMVFVFCLGVLNARSQSAEAEQLLLNVEKLSQLKKILNDMKTGVQIITKGYTAIQEISQGNFNLHQMFLDGLLQVSPAVRNYRKVAEIISMELQLVKEYKSAKNYYGSSGSFDPDELLYFGKVYGKLFDESVNHLNDLAIVVTAGSLRMNDEERLHAIDKIHAGMQDKLDFLRHFNNQAAVLSLQRNKQLSDSKTMQGIYAQ